MRLRAFRLECRSDVLRVKNLLWRHGLFKQIPSSPTLRSRWLRLFRIACKLVKGEVGSPTLVASHFVQAEIDRDDLAFLPVHLDCFPYICG